MTITFDKINDLECINNYWDLHNETNAVNEPYEVKLAFLKSCIMQYIKSIGIEYQRYIFHEKYIADVNGIKDNGLIVINFSEV